LQAAPNRQLTIQPSLQKLNAENNDVMHLAKRACVSYLKCVYLMRDKEIFRFDDIDQQKLAESFGLATVPELDFIKSDKDGNLRLPNTISR
jgi:ATP-dependent RNA helicase DDX10/DBP4